MTFIRHCNIVGLKLPCCRLVSAIEQREYSVRSNFGSAEWEYWSTSGANNSSTVYQEKANMVQNESEASQRKVQRKIPSLSNTGTAAYVSHSPATQLYRKAIVRASVTERDYCLIMFSLSISAPRRCRVASRTDYDRNR